MNGIMSVLGLKSGYTVKYGLSPWAQAIFAVYLSSRPNTDKICHILLDTICNIQRYSQC